jgi:small conductance mechanosensitive channel
VEPYDPIVNLPWGGAPVHLGPALGAGAMILAILIAAAVVIRLAHVFVRGIARALLDREYVEGTAHELTALERKKRQDTIEVLAVNVIRFFVVVIAGLMILEAAFKLDIGPAIAGLGIAGIAIGLGTQHLVRDYLNGALILIENQYAKGDVVRIAGVSGQVEDFTLRRTTLRDQDGTVHTVPNGEITVASNLTRVFARVNQDVQVVYGTDIERATGVVNRVGRELADDATWAPRILEAPQVERVSALGEFGITLKILGTVRASEQWAVAGELRKRLLAAFQESGIEMPQPQRVVLAQSTPALAPPLGAAIAADAPASAETPSEPDTPADAAVAAQETTKGPPG